jgi:hypothetical protein
MAARSSGIVSGFEDTGREIASGQDFKLKKDQIPR